MKLSVRVAHKSWVPAGLRHQPWACVCGGVRRSGRACLSVGDFFCVAVQYAPDPVTALLVASIQPRCAEATMRARKER